MKPAVLTALIPARTAAAEPVLAARLALNRPVQAFLPNRATVPTQPLPVLIAPVLKPSIPGGPATTDIIKTVAPVQQTVIFIILTEHLSRAR